MSLEIRGRFDPGSKVRLLLATTSAGHNPPLRPHEGATVVESAVADASGSVTFATSVPRDGSAYASSRYWVAGRSGHAPLTFRAATVDPDAVQPPLQPDRPFTPRAPDRTPTDGGSFQVGPFGPS